MKKIFFLLFILAINGCSTNEKSTLFNDKKEIKTINYMKMSFDEYVIFMNDYIKESKYPRLENE